MTNFFSDDELIHSYSRAEALEDGQLIDVSDLARQAGLRYPTAVTKALMADIENISPGLQGINDVTGRLWDVIWMARMAILRLPKESRVDTLIYEMVLPIGTARYYQVKLVVGPGDDGAPVFTLMQPDED